MSSTTVSGHTPCISGNREVARELGIAEETVKGYMSNVLQKLQASDRTHAVVIALRRGMLD
ncbi:response regulator transcription factor [Massilia sp. HP4]|uniref:response regulator transcription factor n=1 Tax=Massilia sp. HP4 TaxID=2562316 RepID=UPI0010C0569C|nr:LuxR C-terminal-related transcriptional regulator [Massilia sp. HP4]